jgi:hypothetical protein
MNREIDLDVNKIIEDLEKTNFYNMITTECDSNIVDTNCKRRYDNIKHIQYKDLIFVHTPCRIGRELHCSRTSCSEKNQDCPLCFFSNERFKSICQNINKIIIRKLSNIFILIPNAFPYLNSHLLITTRLHNSQFLTMSQYSIELYSIFHKILKINNGYIFFNGICGNSLNHFHCHFTTSKMPIFEYIDLNNIHSGQINSDFFRGYLIKVKDGIQLQNIIHFLDFYRASYNFILRKQDEILEIIFFIRFCHKSYISNNLNYGASELSGVITSNKLIHINDNEIEKIKMYLEETNNISNYDIFIDNDSGININGGKRYSNKNTLYKKRVYKKHKTKKRLINNAI